MMGRRRTSAAPPAEPAPAEPTPERTAAFVEGELAAAREALESQRANLAAARARYRDALDAGFDFAVAARPTMTEAEIAHEVAERAVDRLTAELDQRRADEAAAAAAAAHAAVAEEVEATLGAYRAAFSELYPSIIQSARLLIRLEAEAALAREHAASVGIVVDAPDAFRGRPGRLREVLSVETRQLWRNPFCGVFSLEQHDLIREGSDGRGVLPAEPRADGTVRPPIYADQRQPFEITTFVPGRAAEAADRLADVLRLPAARPGEAPGWSPRRRLQPAEVLAELAGLDAFQPAAEDLDPKVEQRPLGPPVTVAKPPRPAFGGQDFERAG